MMFRAVLAATVGLLGFTGAAVAQNYPNNVVQIVGQAPGGGLDIAARLLAQQLTKEMGQNYIVVNKAGAAGQVSAQFVASAKPDGYTLLITATNLTIFPFMTPDFFDVEKELTPISMVATIPYVMIVNPKIPATTPRDLVAYAKQNPDGLKWGDGGKGSRDSLAIDQFNRMNGISPVVASYGGTGPAMVALLSGEITAMISSPGPAIENLASKQVRALGVTTSKPSELVPGMPTVASQGFPDYEVLGWYGIFGPKGMPPALATEINRHFAKALQAPDIREKMLGQVMSPEGSMSPAQFSTFVSAELKKFGPQVKAMK